MKRSEYEQAVKRLDDARDALAPFRGPQTEGTDGATIEWGMPFGEVYLTLHLRHDKRLTAATLRRALEISEAIEAWERNEGDWPTAREQA